MLNGRVYGRKKAPPAKNPFANVRDTEPSFVEWGYGGMGSVSNNAGDSRWNKVQSGGTGFSHHEEDEDDGSGAAWIKKRREAREKAAREKEEAAAAAKSESKDTSAEPTTSEDVSAPNSNPQHQNGSVTDATPQTNPLHRHQSSHSQSSCISRGSVDHAVNVVEPKPLLKKTESHTSEEDEDEPDEQDDDDDDSEDEVCDFLAVA